MKLRIATFNVENLFTRPSAMADVPHDVGQQAIDDHAKLNVIAAKAAYTAADIAFFLAMNDKYKFTALEAPKSALVFLQRVRAGLYSVKKDGTVTVSATGRADWTGWFELRREDVSAAALTNTARVITEANADILVCVEAENRPTLLRFNEQVLGAQYQHAYPHVMVIDGNDGRGIDVGILSRYPIQGMRSHVDVWADGERVFSRDCPEYVLSLPNGKQLVVVPNHFKSKRGGDDARAIARRRLQADTAASIVRAAAKNISPYVVLAGDLNDTPDSSLCAPTEL